MFPVDCSRLQCSPHCAIFQFDIFSISFIVIENDSVCNATKTSYKLPHIEGVHEKRNEYKCDRCEKAFSYARALRRHIKAVHEGIKDHECEVCGKAFSRLHHLRDHLKSIHKHVFIK